MSQIAASHSATSQPGVPFDSTQSPQDDSSRKFTQFCIAPGEQPFLRWPLPRCCASTICSHEQPAVSSMVKTSPCGLGPAVSKTPLLSVSAELLERNLPLVGTDSGTNVPGQKSNASATPSQSLATPGGTASPSSSIARSKSPVRHQSRVRTRCKSYLPGSASRTWSRSCYIRWYHPHHQCIP